MKVLATVILLFIIELVSAQSGGYFLLQFNDKGPVETGLGYEYKLDDILNSDSVTSNADYWKIVEFWCSSVCQVDWEYHSKNNKLTEQAKNYIKGCNKHDKSKLYFYNIVLEDPTGRRTTIDQFTIIVRT